MPTNLAAPQAALDETDYRDGRGITPVRMRRYAAHDWCSDPTNLLIIDDFLTVGIDSDAASDLFAILANREHRLPTMLASQTGPAHWVAELPDRVAAESIVNRLANNARIINLGEIDMRRHRNDQARAHDGYWEQPRGGPGTQPGPLPPRQNVLSQRIVDTRFHDIVDTLSHCVGDARAAGDSRG